MKRSFSILFCFFVLVFGQTFGVNGQEISVTYKTLPANVSPELKTDFRDSQDAEFEKESGGGLYALKVSAARVRYEYLGEWYEFAPAGIATVASSAASDTILKYVNCWADTDITISAREYGVKYEIILKKNSAPSSFSFDVIQSEGWNDHWILPPYAWDANYLEPVPLRVEKHAGILSYVLPDDLSAYKFPIIIDPSFDIAGSDDDSQALKGDGVVDMNAVTSVATGFGKFTGGENYTRDGYVRYAINIPRASKIESAVLDCKSYDTRTVSTGVLQCNVAALFKDNKWEVDGFGLSNYATATALNAIATSLSVPAYNAYTWEDWAAGSWYDLNAANGLQYCVDQLSGSNEYDPLHAENKYVGFRFYNPGGAYLGGNVRSASTYDVAAADSVDLDVTFTAWAEIRTANGMKYDSAYGIYRYFDY